MLYYLLIYQFESGLLLYEKDFKVEDKSRIELFGPFFSAIKSFLSELWIDGLNELKTVGFGSFTAFMMQIPEVKIDIVIIADKDDSKIIKNLSSRIIKIIINYKELFTTESIISERFQEFDTEINEFILSNKKFINSNLLLENTNEFLKPIWNQRGKISQQLREEKERIRKENLEKLILLKDKLMKEKNIIIKYKLCNQILKFAERFDNNQTLKDHQNLANNLYSEITERELKLSYYLSETKEKLNNIIHTYKGNYLINANYHEVYSNLYSFSSKLKNFASDNIYIKYLTISRKLINKSEINQEEFSDLINQILQMEDDIKKYYIENI